MEEIIAKMKELNGTGTVYALVIYLCRHEHIELYSVKGNRIKTYWRSFSFNESEILAELDKLIKEQK